MDGKFNTEDLPLKPFKASPESAPMNDGSVLSSCAEFKSDKIQFVPAGMDSFDDFQNLEQPWIRSPESMQDFFRFVTENEEFLEANAQWIKPANAESDEELLSVANHGDPHKKYINNGGLTGMIGTKVRPGEILFCKNKNKQLLYGEGVHSFYRSLTKKSGRPVNVYSTSFIQKGIITIVTLQPNQIAVGLDNQKPVILLPGRHCYHNPKFILTKGDIFTIEDCGPNISHSTVTLVRIGDWEVGLGFEEGQPVLLRPGLHVSRSPAFQCTGIIDTRSLELRGFVAKLSEGKLFEDEKEDRQESKKRKKKAPKAVVRHENISLVRIEQKEYGKAYINGSPALLLPGLHLNAASSFIFEGTVLASIPHIKFDNLHVIQVQSEQFGLGWEGQLPVLIGPGIWHKNSPLFRFDGFRLATETVIRHGSITRYQVRHGEVGFAWHNGMVEQLESGIQTVDDANFVFEKTQQLSDPIVQFGNIAYITTREAECRPVYVNGKLRILQAGSVKFDESNLVVGVSFTTAEIIHPLKQVEVLTRDRTPMLVTGQVNYQIVRPNELMLNLGYDKLADSLEQSVHAILRHAFSITDLSTISPDKKEKALEEAVMADVIEKKKPKKRSPKEPVGPSTSSQPDYEEEEEQEEKRPLPVFQVEQEVQEGQNFQGSLCHEVHAELIRLTRSWGIDVKDLAISDIQFKDQEVANKLAAATSNTRTAEAEFDLTLAEARIRLERAQANAQEQLVVQTNGAKIKKIDAENNSLTKLIQERAKAEADALKRSQEIQTEVEAVKARAQGRADEMASMTEARVNEMTCLAEAQRTADLLRAEGQKALAEAQIVQYSNPHVLQLEMMKQFVKVSEALSKAPTPAVLLQNSVTGGGYGRGGGGGGNDEMDADGNHVGHRMPGMAGGMGSDMLNVFRTQGKTLLESAMNINQFKPVCGAGAKDSKANAAKQPLSPPPMIPKTVLPGQVLAR